MISTIVFQIAAPAASRFQTEDPEFCHRAVRGDGTG
jgi:hypothetical protein